MDKKLTSVRRAFLAEPTWEAFAAYAREAKRASAPIVLEEIVNLQASLPHSELSSIDLSEDLLQQFTLFQCPLAEIYQRTQLISSNILSARSAISAVTGRDLGQRVSANFASVITLADPNYSEMLRRWFLDYQRKRFVYYFDRSPDERGPLFVEIPYYMDNLQAIMPYEICNNCGRQTFLTELVEADPYAEIVGPEYVAQLDCFEIDPEHGYIVEDEHQAPLVHFSGGYGLSLFSGLSRMRDTPLGHISPPSLSIELPIS